MIATRLAVSEEANGASDVLDSILGVVCQRGLKAGDQLPSIRELADKLEIKPTAVRDALLRAQAMGLVKILPRAGAFLRATALPKGCAAAAEDAVPSSLMSALAHDDHNLFHLLDARRLVEIELVGRAAQRRRLEDLLPVRRALDAMLRLPSDAARAEYINFDIRFHVEVASLAGNLVLLSVERTLMELLRPHLNDVPRGRHRREQTDRSHVAIYEALVAGDAEKARTEMCEHLSLAYDGLLRDLQELPTVGDWADDGRCPMRENSEAGT